MFLGNRRGSILVTVLAVVAVITVLGAVLGGAALNDQKQAKRQQKNNEAFYLARSGAEAVAAMLLKEQDKIGDYIGQTTEASLGSGRFSVTVGEGENGEILITSTGFSGDWSEKITLSLVNDGSSGFRLPVLDMAVFSHGEIACGAPSGSPNISGKVGTNTVLPGGVKVGNGGGDRITGDLYIGPGGNPTSVVPNNRNKIVGSIFQLDEERTYPMPEFPDFPSNLSAGGNYETTWNQAEYWEIAGNKHYGTVTVNSNRNLHIDVGAGVTEVWIDHLSVSGKVTLKGTGRLVLYVDKLTFGAAEINTSGDENNLLICYRGTPKLDLNNNIHIAGFLFTKTADFGISSSAWVKGGIFIGGTSVVVNGDGDAVVTAFYAPNADFTLGNSGKVNGGIVCKNFYAPNGNGRVKYNSAIQGIWDMVPGLDFSSIGSPDGAGYKLGSWSD